MVYDLIKSEHNHVVNDLLLVLQTMVTNQSRVVHNTLRLLLDAQNLLLTSDVGV